MLQMVDDSKLKSRFKTINMLHLSAENIFEIKLTFLNVLLVTVTLTLAAIEAGPGTGGVTEEVTVSDSGSGSGRDSVYFIRDTTI